MKFKGKKGLAILLGGMLALSGTNHFVNNIVGVQSVSEISSDSLSEKDEQELSTYKEELKEQFDSKDVVLDTEKDDYISSVYIDGRNVKVELADGTMIEGELNSLELGYLHLKNFHMFDSKFEKGVIEHTGHLKEYYQETSESPKLNLSIANLDEVVVTNELKISNQILDHTGDNAEDYDDINFGSIKHIDFSKCENIWLYNFHINRSNLKQLNSNKRLKKLVLDNVAFDGLPDNKLVIKSPNLTTLIVNPFRAAFRSDNITDFDFNNCNNLRTLSFGNGTYIHNLNGLSELKNLETMSFGNHMLAISFDLNQTFEEKKDEINHTYYTYDPNVSKDNNNFITDISALSNSNITTLNITNLMLISDKQLLELVKSLPNLEKIVGLEVNNATMYSDELVEFCKEHNIEQPFTEKSKLIKKKIQSIIHAIIEPDMTESEKIEAISRHVINKLHYKAEDIDDVSQEYSSEIIKAQWGENLYTATMENEALCAGYTNYTQALLTEAGISNFKSITEKHIYNIVELNGKYYQLDLTFLDSLLNDKKIDPNDYNFEFNSAYYLVPVGDEEAEKSNSEPYEAKEQREDFNSHPDFYYDVYEDSSTTENIKSELDSYALMGVLMALSVAIPVSAYYLYLLQKQAIKSAGINCPIWTTDDMNELVGEIKETDSPTHQFE